MALYVMTLLVTGSPEEVEPVAAKYREQLAALGAEGKLHAAGEFSDGDGFMVVLDVADRMEAERLARRSPLVDRGLGTWMLRPWHEL